DRVRGDEARIAAHELHEPDSVARSLGLRVGCIGRSLCLGHGGLEGAGRLRDRDVVVDGLGNADDAELETPPCSFGADLLCAMERPVAADREEDADLELLQGGDHLRRILWPARGTEYGSAHLMAP